MKIEVAWDDEDNTVIRYTFMPGWTLEEFHQVFDSVSDMIGQSPHRVIGIIVDDSQGANPPSNALGAFRRTVSRGKLPLAIVGAGRMSKILMKVAEEATTNKRPIFYAKTLEEARCILREIAGANPNE